MGRIPQGYKTAGVVNCGPIFKDDACTQVDGSTFNVEAETRQEVVDFVLADPFAKGGVWDLDSIVIIATKSVGRIGKATQFTP